MAGHTPGPWRVAWGESTHRKGAYGDGPGGECGPRCKPDRVSHDKGGEGRWSGVTECHHERSSVADIIGADDEHVVCFGHDYDEYGLIGNLANAPLLAAAWDYHAAAELVFAQELTGETVLIDKAAWDALMAAHQKASGK